MAAIKLKGKCKVHLSFLFQCLNQSDSGILKTRDKNPAFAFSSALTGTKLRDTCNPVCIFTAHEVHLSIKYCGWDFLRKKWWTFLMRVPNITCSRDFHVNNIFRTMLARKCQNSAVRMVLSITVTRMSVRIRFLYSSGLSSCLYFLLLQFHIKVSVQK